MTRKIVSVLLALCLFIGCVPVLASADVAPTSGNCGAAGNESGVTWRLSGNKLTISGSGGMGDYAYMRFDGTFDGDPAPWYAYKDDITSVDIGDGITRIGNTAFGQCENLTSVSLPNSLTSIGMDAFYGCSGLKSITLPESVTSIENNAFLQCSGLTSFTIPEGVTSIGAGAFQNCSDLTNITIPKNVTTIGDRAFLSCTGLTAIQVAEENANYISENGVLFNKGKTKLIFCPTKKTGAYVIPASVTTIEEFAFQSCTGLTSVTIPDSVTSIGNAAFDGCTGLTSVTIPNGVTSIEDRTFYACFGLTRVTIPDSVTSIGDSAFYACTGLTNITIPDSVTSIGSFAFSGCSKLTTVTIPASVTTLGGAAFYGASKLKTAIFEGDAPTIVGETSPFVGRGNDFCIYYADGAKGWTTPTWTAKGVTHSCKPLSQMNPDKPNPPVNPDTPVTPSEPTVETVTTEAGNTATVTTQPGVGKEIEVKTPSGETVAKVNLPADPGKGKTFTDVKGWYEGAVDKATAYGLFQGTSETTFSPDSSMTRGMLANVLYNLSGKSQYGVGEGAFADVAENIWYEDAADWAAKTGVTSGTGKAKFSPNKSVTRQDMVTMLYRYAKLIGAESKNSAGLEKFPDAGKVSGYAKEAMQWAVAEGFISGRTSGGKNYIAPQGTATRAEVAAVLTRFVEYLKK